VVQVTVDDVIAGPRGRSGRHAIAIERACSAAGGTFMAWPCGQPGPVAYADGNVYICARAASPSLSVVLREDAARRPVTADYV
jgi:hypothetical protein